MFLTCLCTIQSGRFSRWWLCTWRYPAARLFGGLFVVQGVLFALRGGLRPAMQFGAQWNSSGVVGGVLLAYALLIYPLIGIVLGHAYPAAPTFGVPCPTTIFTFGLLLWTTGRMPSHLQVIPALWALLAVSAALNWGVWEDIVMPVAAVTACGMFFARDRRLRATVARMRATSKGSIPAAARGI